MSAYQGKPRGLVDTRLITAFLVAARSAIMLLALVSAACQTSPLRGWATTPASTGSTQAAEPTAESTEHLETVEATPALAATPVPSGAPSPPMGPTGTGILAQEWQRLDTTGGGGQTGIAPHPNDPDIVYMASDNGGLYKTENGGDSWFSVSSNLGAYRLGTVTLDPLDPNIVYVTAYTSSNQYAAQGIRGELYRSRNGGASWELVSDEMGFRSSFPNQAAIVIPYDPVHPERFDRNGDHLSDVILVGSWSTPTDPPVGGVWRSNDGGDTFVQLALTDKDVTALHAFDREASVLFLTAYEGGIYRSEDLGETWTNITNDLPQPHLADVAIHPNNPDVLLVSCRPCQPQNPPVWKTENGGKQWKPASKGLNWKDSNAFPRILIDRFTPNTYYVTTFDGQRGVYRGTKSLLGGIRWRQMPATLTLPDGRPYHAQRFPGGLIIAQAIDGRLFAGGGGGWRYPGKSADGGSPVWEPATIGVGNIHVNAVRVDPLDPAVLYQGISDRGPYKSVDGGATFHRILGTGWPVTTENFVWNGPYYSNYKECAIRCSETCTARGQISSGGTTDFAISRQNSDIVYSSFGSGSNRNLYGGINKSTDGGKTWQPVGFQLEQGFELNPETCVPYGFRRLAIDPTNDEIVFAAMEHPDTQVIRLYRTTDGGATWTVVLDTLGAITGLEISLANPDVIVLTTQQEIMRSEQGGIAGSFEDIKPPQISNIEALALSPHHAQVYAIGTRNDGLYYTSNGGRSWIQNDLRGFFEQKTLEDSEAFLEESIATAFNPRVKARQHVSAIVFDPISEDTLYVGSDLRPRAGFGVARITNAGQNWERLPVAGLTHRNIFDLAIDRQGKFLYAGTFEGTFKFVLRQ